MRSSRTGCSWAVLFGLGSLGELRDCLLAAESELNGGASPRVSPFADARDAAGLLQRAGFALPVADVETVTVTYPDALALMHDLRGMGEANALAGRAATAMRAVTVRPRRRPLCPSATPIATAGCRRNSACCS